MAIEQPRHWSAPEVFGSRAKFHFDSQPATLEIKVSSQMVPQHKQRQRQHDQLIYHTYPPTRRDFTAKTGIKYLNIPLNLSEA